MLFIKFTNHRLDFNIRQQISKLDEFQMGWVAKKWRCISTNGRKLSRRSTTQTHFKFTVNLDRRSRTFMSILSALLLVIFFGSAECRLILFCHELELRLTVFFNGQPLSHWYILMLLHTQQFLKADEARYFCIKSALKKW